MCQQGAQFEIVLKAKQARNSQFDFLRFDHYLNPYYKHILRAMKEGRYNLASDKKQEQSQGEFQKVLTEFNAFKHLRVTHIVICVMFYNYSIHIFVEV